MTDTNTNGWSIWAKHVLSELKRHNKWLASLDENLNNHVTDLDRRITRIEERLKSQNRLFYVIITALIGIFSMVFVQLVM